MPRIASLLLVLLCFAVPAWAEPDRPLLVVVTNSFVLSAKFEKLAAWAEETSLAFRLVEVESAEGTQADWLDGADFVLLDTPRPSDLAQVEQRLGSDWRSEGLRWLRLGGGPPAFGGFAPEDGRRLAAYYASGGEANLRLLLRYLDALHSGADASALPPAQPLPQTGLYHPEAPAPFAAVEDYLAWGAGRWPDAAPRIAFAIHASLLSNMQTGALDHLVARAEAQGLVPLAFWFEASDPEGLGRLLRPARAEVLVNLQHMQNGAARSAEFLELDIPVLQGLSYRDGDPQDWQEAPSGLRSALVASFLSVPESWGIADPLVVSAVRDGAPVAIEAQVEALLAKAARLAALRRTPAREKRLAVLFWNYPPGEKNLSASNLNVPRSLARLTQALAEAGYDVPPAQEPEVIAAGQALLGGLYDPQRLDGLLAEDLADAFPLSRYRTWLDRLPETPRQALLSRWGEPEEHWALREIEGEPQFVVPRLRLGNLAVLPQPPRSGRAGEHYHDGAVPPDHLYLASYLYLRDGFGADALVHFGTHGTQEWLPGRDRGLSTEDFPFLAVADLPVFYPYIQDNVGEALQARRRGRAVTVSHQTPPFAPAGLYEELLDLHELVHDHLQLEPGPVRERVAASIRESVLGNDLHRDLEWDEAAVAADFGGFLEALHDHLHDLARSVMPLGLHSFGEAPRPEHRLSTVMQQLGEPYYRSLGLDPDEVFAEDFRQLQQSPAYRLLQHHFREGAALEEVADDELRALLERGRELDGLLADNHELSALLAALEGRFVAPGPGGDPVRSPEVPNGRNLYAFEPDKIPTREAYAAGGAMLDELLEAHEADHGSLPQKLAFSLWSSETIRQLGVLEGQLLQALGLRPLWDEGGRVTALEIVPAEELGRPRIDVVVQVTSVYRDQFDGFMRLLAEAIDRLAELDEPDNPVARNTRRLANQLTGEGEEPARARALAALRLFSNAPGDYGSGLPEEVLRSDLWDDEAVLAEHFLARLQYAYGVDDWGAAPTQRNLLAAQLRGVEAAVLSRSSNLHGLLSTDHPFEYLGGLALAVRYLDGRSPALYLADLRNPEGRIAGAARFLATELRTRSLNPHWIAAMQEEGYAGTLALLKQANNFWGWQVTAPETVRADQWQALHETYLMDRRELGLEAWFETHNPTAQAQILERLVEAVRKGYWDPDEQTRRELAEHWQRLVEDQGSAVGAASTADFMTAMAAGFGMGQAAPAEGGNTGGAAAAAEVVRGQVLVPQESGEAGGETPWQAWLGLGLLLACLGAGAARQMSYTTEKTLR